MALSNLNTPGVYVEEISTFPASIAAVGTAIPAFIGYTETGSENTPIRIASLIEFNQFFGGAYKEIYKATLNGSDELQGVTPSTVESKYNLYYHLQMYFANGGGPCHIISVGHYDPASPVIVAKDFYDSLNPANGIGAAELVDEVTLLVAPEVAELTSDADILSVYTAMLTQCNKLRDRFCIFDVNTTLPHDVVADTTKFRNFQVGANFLKYGAAYYPPLDTILRRSYSSDEVLITGGSFAAAPNNRLSTILEGIGTYTTLDISPGGPGDSFTITAGSTSATFTFGVDFSSTPSEEDVVNAINNHPTLSLVVRAQVGTGSNIQIVVRKATADTNSATLLVGGLAPFAGPYANVAGVANSQNTTLYNAIAAAIGSRVLTLGPSATMAGIYAAVDNARGVWKAPANVSVANIIGPNFLVTEKQQGDLNIDATSGKSINVIRTFTGRGTLVWGARTLEGNSNEWRYVPVRRLFIMVEESAKKASEFVVFEPNDKSTWLRVKGMISNFLTDLWKQGALAGEKPEQAFFVRVGLGETMTAQDILEGKMIVSIGLAAVRPAEFIVLQFMHKLQEA
ncbi:MAG: phage tail sheath C-terminal domain-containing protein [Bacteroidia bacterium]